MAPRPRATLPKCKTGDRLNWAECKLAKILGQCSLSFFSEVQCEATCGVACCGDSNFANCPALVDLQIGISAALMSGCQLAGNDYLCRKSCNVCNVGQPTTPSP